VGSATAPARGLAAATAAFAIWGLLPVYLHALRAVPALQVIAHRVAWSCLFLFLWMLARRDLGRLASTFGRPPLLAGLLLSAALISCNWLMYIWGVTHAHIVDTSLGYYINPLMNVLLGVFVLRERLNRAQWIALSLAAIAVLYLTLLAGRPPWIAGTLAVSFSLYGLVRKVISVDALPGLATETLLLLPLAVGYLLWCEADGSAAFGHASAFDTALLIGSGLVTALPLSLFAFGARTLPYSTVGMLQYIAPSLQLACGVLLYHEGFGAPLALGFALIWAALLIYAADGWWRSRSGTRAVRPASA
jgi:chloramphenicol-sensitive protein RarD